jgi:hypothetical protein
MTKILDSIEQILNYTTTDNGAITNSSSLNKCVDFFAAGGAIRNQSDENILSLFTDAFNENKTNAVRLAYMFRDIRGGQGQRRPFRVQLEWLANHYPEQTKNILSLVPEYGRWDDLYSAFGTPCEKHALSIIKNQIDNDIENMKSGNAISLLGKWLCRINTSSKETIRKAHITRRYLELDNKSYRKLCSSLNAYLNTTEVLMSSNRWGDINYEKIPSQCLFKHTKAFNKRDTERYQEYILLAQQGKVKVNAATLYPYQIIGKILDNDIADNEAELLWNNLTDYEMDSNAIVVADVSGSMMGLPMNVCISLALYLSQRAIGPYNNKFITFSSNPELVNVTGDNIVQKVRNMSRANWSMNTNMKAVFDLVLNAAIKSKAKPEEMVDKLYIISDMQFDEISETSSDNIESFYETVKKQYEDNGYKIPQLVFWNVNASVKNFPVISNTENTCMISGFSPSILKYLNMDVIPSPEVMMLEVINSPRYSNINF